MANETVPQVQRQETMSEYQTWEWASSDEQFLVIPDVRVPYQAHQNALERIKWAWRYVPDVRIMEDNPNRVINVHFKIAEETLKYARDPKGVLEHVVGHIREKLWSWYRGTDKKNDEWVGMVPWQRG